MTDIQPSDFRLTGWGLRSAVRAMKGLSEQETKARELAQSIREERSPMTDEERSIINDALTSIINSLPVANDSTGAAEIRARLETAINRLTELDGYLERIC